MVSILQSLAEFEGNEPRMCIWCRHGLLLMGNGQEGERVACLKRARTETREPRAMRPLPPNVEGRDWLPVFNADERRDCFEPTEVASRRMRFLDCLGLAEVDA